MKKIVFIISFCIFVGIGGVLFGIHNFSTSKVKSRDFIVVKGQGENMYPYRLTFDKGTSAIEVLRGMEEKDMIPKKIFIRKSHSWKGVSDSDKIYYDTTIKARF